jgi:hypothetical protein
MITIAERNHVTGLCLAIVMFHLSNKNDNFLKLNRNELSK